MSFQYMPFYTGDYRRDTIHLSMAEHGCFCLLLMYYWDQKAPLPLDERRLMAICNARSGDEIEAMRRVLSEFFIRMEDGWYNKRMQREIEKAENLSRSLSEAGRKGYETRVKNKDATLKPPLSHPQASVSTIDLRPYTKPNPNLDLNPNVKTLQLNKEHSTESTEEAAVDSNDQKCPHKEIVALYRKLLPMLSQPKIWDTQRQTLLRNQWRARSQKNGISKGYDSIEEGLKYWERFFLHIVDKTTLPQGYERQAGKSRWFPDLPWLLKPENFKKIVEGKYDK